MTPPTPPARGRVRGGNGSRGDARRHGAGPRLAATLAAWALTLALPGCGEADPAAEPPADSAPVPAPVAAPERENATVEPAAPPEAPPPIAEPSLHEEPPPVAGDSVAPTIEDPSGKALDRFLGGLRRLESQPKSGEHVRVVHWGDSSIGADDFPDQIRSRLWLRFGDGGPGFVFPIAKSGGHVTRVVAYGAERGRDWQSCGILGGCLDDGAFGLGARRFTAPPGAISELHHPAFVATRPEEPRWRRWGRRWATVELWFAKAPKSAKVGLRVDHGDWLARVETKGRSGSGWASVALDPSRMHTLELRSMGPASAALYGLVLESDEPGVVWDALEIRGGVLRRLLRWDPAHLAEQVAHRNPDLLVLQMGGNDLQRAESGTDTATMEAEMTELLGRLRAGAPEASCLVIGLSTHDESAGQPVSRERLRAFVDFERRAAFASGCAFFDAVAALAPAGDGPALRRAGWLERDGAHLTSAGRAQLGQQLFDALIRELDTTATPHP